jgi:hypothetical protein
MKDQFHISLATMDAVPNWLKADDAERLRSSIEAHRILDGEYQVGFCISHRCCRCTVRFFGTFVDAACALSHILNNNFSANLSCTVWEQM